ncbi:MAG TPA: translation initiation factor IF-2 [Gammaproteobacteria bacterium]|nr:translation initiation factor IF-2 [Gammaproteobacteria bacterium]
MTVGDFAQTVGIPAERLLEQLAAAGITGKRADDVISDEEKAQLLRHKKQEQQGGAPNRITLKRKSTSEVRVPGGASRGKTVTVEVRKKRTYVKRADVDDQERQREAEEAAAREAELAREREEEEARRRAAEEEQARAKAAEEEQARRRAAEEEQARAKAAEEEQARRQAASAAPSAPAPTARRVTPPTAEDRAKARRSNRGGREATDDRRGAKTKYGRKELHLEKGAAARTRKKSSRRPGRVERGDANPHAFERPTQPVVREVPIPETITVGELAQRMAVKATEVIKVMMNMGAMATINQTIDQETAAIVVDEIGHKPKLLDADELETELADAAASAPEDAAAEARAPVVTVMGHVDHGKTTLLDTIRSTQVAAREAGGITQHIGAYRVTAPSGQPITFLDTPGHAAFTAMRARGAKMTDIVILVVAADDSVMPQTVEAIQHARAAGVPLIVAVNKIDRPEADLDRVRNDLAQHEVIPEEWGGDAIFIPVSAKTGEGVEQLLEAILLQAEVLELSAVADGPARGAVVEASVEKGRGPVATLLVQNGTLRQGDIVLCGQEYGRVRAMFDENGEAVTAAGPSMPVLVLGLSGAPQAGDEMVVVADERKAREVASHRHGKTRDVRLARQQATKLEDVFNRMGEGVEQQQLNLIIKADTQGSAEALQQALSDVSNAEVQVRVLGQGAGGITESDINLAVASQAIIIGFNVRADGSARRLASEQDVDLRYYSVIYEAIDEIRNAVSGMMAPRVREEMVGLAEVRDVFHSSKMGAVAGCLVVDGSVRRSSPIRVLRDNVVIYEGELESLRRFKDDVQEVRAGTECGIAVRNYNDVRPGDQIEVFERIVEAAEA